MVYHLLPSLYIDFYKLAEELRFLLVLGQSRSALDSLRSSSFKMASDGAKGSNYAHSFVSGTSSRCEHNTILCQYPGTGSLA